MAHQNVRRPDLSQIGAVYYGGIRSGRAGRIRPRQDRPVQNRFDVARATARRNYPSSYRCGSDIILFYYIICCACMRVDVCICGACLDFL
jgi:hypothetical protein